MSHAESKFTPRCRDKNIHCKINESLFDKIC